MIESVILTKMICARSGVSANSRKSTKECAKLLFFCAFFCAKDTVSRTFWCAFWNWRLSGLKNANAKRRVI